MKAIPPGNDTIPGYATKMLWQGVHEYILKNSGEEVFIHAIESVFGGEEFIDASIREMLSTQGMRSRHILTSKTTLSIRKKEVLEQIVNGLTDQEIAHKFFFGRNTIKYYRKSILMTLDAKNTAELVRKVLLCRQINYFAHAKVFTPSPATIPRS